MTNKVDGIFSLGLASLKLQLEALFQDAGGGAALKLMDKLSSLEPEARANTLRAFSRALDQLIAAQQSTPEEKPAPHEWEDSLYRDISSNLAPQLEVVPGGKEKKQSASAPIDLETARKNRQSKSVLH